MHFYPEYIELESDTITPKNISTFAIDVMNVIDHIKDCEQILNNMRIIVNNSYGSYVEVHEYEEMVQSFFEMGEMVVDMKQVLGFTEAYFDKPRSNNKPFPIGYFFRFKGNRVGYKYILPSQQSDKAHSIITSYNLAVEKYRKFVYSCHEILLNTNKVKNTLVHGYEFVVSEEVNNMIATIILYKVVNGDIKCTEISLTNVYLVSTNHYQIKYNDIEHFDAFKEHDKDIIRRIYPELVL